MTGGSELSTLIDAVAAGDRTVVARMLDATPALSRATLARSEERFLESCHLQVYAGDTALHVAAAAYEVSLARRLLDAGADVGARNRRGAEPLHAAMTGAPGSDHWDPPRQEVIIALLIDAGADPDAGAVGGVTPLHRAVRNRCAAAVETLLRLGADPALANDHGSTAAELARWTTGRGGTGSTEARAEQQRIVELLATAAGRG